MRNFKIIPILMIIFIIFSNSIVLASEAEEHKLRVLVIEQNPMLKSVGITAAEQLGQADDLEVVVDEMIEDIEYSSHGLVDVEIIGCEYFNEFLTSKEPMRLANGSMSYTLDEDTWFHYMKDGWRRFWLDRDIEEIGEYKYDYEYLMNKFNLVERRNNDEFDQVWLVGADPINPFETIMVGENAYWVNGDAIQKDCDNFIIMTLYISRRDANFECFGHMAENVMREVFGRTYDSYEKNQVRIDSLEDLEDLNLWERFCLTAFSSNYTYASVGNIHFAPNSKDDYDWLNKSYIQSDWIDWRENYPNLTGETVLTNYETWCPTGNPNTACRDHHRWWFSLFPHVGGKTEDGYSHSWWDYLISLDFATELYAETIELEEDENLSKFYIEVLYNSGKRESFAISDLEDTLVIKDDDIVSYKKGKLIGKKEGKTYIEVSLDGIILRINVEVTESEEDNNVRDDGGKKNNKNEKEYDYESWYGDKELVDDELYNKYSLNYTWSIASDWAISELETAQNQMLIAKILDNRNFTEFITREEFAVTMVKLYESINGLKAELPEFNPFIDTYNEDVLKAYNLGVTKGISSNTFSPSAFITRQEIATMLMRLIDVSGVYIDDSELMIYLPFMDDIYIADWAKESIYYMYNKEIIKGKENNIFAPLDNTSIEEALVLAVRTLYDCKY